MKNAQNAHTVNVWNTLNWIYEFQYRDFHDKIYNEDVVICFIFLIRLKKLSKFEFRFEISFGHSISLRENG